ncbi:ATP-binding protein, partial [candidate division KSB1 bacterium]
PEKIVEIERKMMLCLSPVELNLMLPRMRKLRYKSFRELLKSYPEYVLSLAERLEKQINPFSIIGDDVYVDPDKYEQFAKSLVHVFRNMIDHGIETPEERVENGKDEFGNLNCFISKNDSDLILIIGDDGSGINTDKIKEKAVSSGMYDNKTITKLSREELTDLIFKDEISTKDKTTEISGRGIGLSAVKKALDNLDGRISVDSVKGKGTTFIFTLPVAKSLPKTSFLDMIDPVSKMAEEFIKKELKLSIDKSSTSKLSGSNRLSLKEWTSIIRLRGVVKGSIIFTYDNSLAEQVVSSFVSGEIKSENKMKYIEESCGEVANIIAGRSITNFKDISDLVSIDPPVTIHSENADIVQAESEIISRSYVTSAGEVSINVLISGIF